MQNPAQNRRQRSWRQLAMLAGAGALVLLLGTSPAAAYRQRLHSSGEPYRFRADDVDVYVLLDASAHDEQAVGRFRHLAAVAADRWSRPTCAALRLTLTGTPPLSPAIIVRLIDVPASDAERDEMREPQTTHIFADGRAEISKATVHLDARLLSQPSSITERHLTLGLGQAIGLLPSAVPTALMHNVHRAAARAEIQPDDIAGLCDTYGRSPKDVVSASKDPSLTTDPLRKRRRENIHRRTLSLRESAGRSRTVVLVLGFAAMMGWIAHIEIRRRRRKDDK